MCSLLLWAALAWAAPAVASQEVTPELRQALLTAVRDNPADHDFDHWDAEVWLVAKDSRLRRFIADEDQRLVLLRLIHQEAGRVALPAELILAVIEVESAFDSYAISSAGAQGLMQVMAFWKNEIGRPDDNLTQIDTNLRYGSTILAHYHQMENGNLESALARYNGSYGQTWYARRVMAALENWR